MKRRSLVFVVSDFISQPGWAAALARLSRRHDVVAVRLWDPLEMALPDPGLGLVTLEDAETGEQVLVDAADPAFRARYAAWPTNRKRPCCRTWPSAGADVVELATDDDLLDALMRFCDLRRQSGPAEGAAALSGGDAPCAERSSRREPPHDQVPVARPAVAAAAAAAAGGAVPVAAGAQAAQDHAAPGQRGRGPSGRGQGPGWRRHVPPLLMLLAVAAGLLAVARPTATLTLPLAERTIMLAMDVSGSMRAEDVKPNRLVASQEAAKTFVNNLPREVRVGVVSFAGTAAVVQAPTTSRDDVIAAIDRFQLQRGTATGSGIILSLATLFPDAGIEIQHVTGQRNFPGKAAGRRPTRPKRSSRPCPRAATTRPP
jgi:hypothetical protein